jgi:hypothetical protein
VKDTASSASFKRRIGIAAFVIVLLHILFSLFVAVLPMQHVSSNAVTSLYNRLILLGPFFHESRIKASPHVYVRYKVNDAWTQARDYGKENFTYYCEHPWRYDKLHFNDFERYISHQIGKQSHSKPFNEISKSRVFRELNQFLLQEPIQEPVDSVTVMYGFNLYLPEAKTFTFDTIFTYTYNPKDIAPAKK